ncbi:FUSC family protein [Segnochrobactrum spirostomi]|uniref:FUSC family protein n=1 Tax=Segnochrobactrum spirostomi TaxID=2608987 RepID=A0A6A7Y029_9HYPH|nr:FUSC family protein [Segnochrobactrum spirostomi]MQT11858.1 FUSC family protein [Segnochrobactrum spirostomi]
MLGRLRAALPSGDDFLFSVKAFAGAMLALYIALRLDLPRPAWAMGTAYIVAHPLSGAVSSKAVYRVLGTLLGAAAAIVLVPNLANAPEVLSLAMALWIGFCLFVSLLDRTPRAYAFMLAGYTAAIIGFPSVADPAAIFDTALARSEEIILGILCAALASRLLFPRHVGPVISARVQAWLAEIDKLSVGAIEGSWTDEQRIRGRARLAGDASELHALATHLDYDPSDLQGMTRQMQALQSRMVIMLPLLGIIRDRVVALKEATGAVPPQEQALLDAVRRWMAVGPTSDPDEGTRLRAASSATLPALDAAADWTTLLRASLFARLRDFIDLRTDCCRLWTAIVAGDRRLPEGLHRTGEPMTESPLHLDLGIAALSAVAAMAGVLVCCLMWISTSWADGATAAQMVAVGMSLMATQDNPVPALTRFIYGALAAMAIVFVYQFLIFPSVDGFPALVAVLAPVFVLAGAYMIRPSTAPIALAITVNTAVLLGIQDRYSADVATFFNANIAAIGGFVIAVIVLSLMRTIGAEQAGRRLLAAAWRDVADAAGRPNARPRVFARRMIDRLGLLMPRLALAPSLARGSERAMVGVAVGVSTIELRAAVGTLPAPARDDVERLVAELQDYFSRRAGDPTGEAPAPPVADIDTALRDLLRLPEGLARRNAVFALVALRRGLHPSAEPYRAAVPTAPLSAPRPVEVPA